MDVLEPLPNPVQHFNQEEDEDEYGNNEASGQVTRSRRDFLSSPTTHSCEMSDTEDLCNNSMTFFDTEEDFLTKRHLIVNYLPQTFTDAELYNTFSPFGPLDSVRIMKDSETGYSFGFGFVNFTTDEVAIAAQRAMNGFEVATKKIKVSFARPPSDDIKHTNLYITNLPRNITEPELLNIFKPFGPIIQKKLLRDKYTNLPRGVAFIRYEKRDQASTAIMKLNNCIPPGCAEPLRVRLAEDHGKQKAAYLSGFQAGMMVPKRSSNNSNKNGKWKAGRGKSRSKNNNTTTKSRQYSHVRKQHDNN